MKRQPNETAMARIRLGTVASQISGSVGSAIPNAIMPTMNGGDGAGDELEQRAAVVLGQPGELVVVRPREVDGDLAGLDALGDRPPGTRAPISAAMPWVMKVNARASARV